MGFVVAVRPQGQHKQQYLVHYINANTLHICICTDFLESLNVWGQYAPLAERRVVEVCTWGPGEEC